MLNDLLTWILESQAREFSLWALRNIPGFPPIIQSLHLISIAALMASAVFLSLRILGLAVLSQDPREMALRLKYWALFGIGGTLFSGLFFFLARPNRYLNNPVFQIKFSLLVPALIASLLMFYFVSKHEQQNFRVPMKILALVTMVLWICVAMAGRWIAYSEYLFWPEV